jgi:hypothetical protein
MLGFKNFRNAAVTISGIELVEKIKKRQFDTSRIRTSAGASVAYIWEMMTAT